MASTSFKVTTLSAALIFLSTTGVTFAKGYKGDFKGEACPPPPMLMSGFYVGAQVGYDAYKIQRNQVLPLGPNVLSASNSAGAFGWVGGLMAGYGTVLNNWFYLGAEVFGSFSDAEGTTAANIAGPGALTDNITTTVHGSYGIGLLPGVKIAENYLGYIRLGWNRANLREQVNVIVPGVLNQTATRSNNSNGFVFGVGMEALLVDNWSIRGEYNHTWYESFTVTNPIIGTCKVTPSDNQYMLGLLYHFA